MRVLSSLYDRDHLLAGARRAPGDFRESFLAGFTRHAER